jgi:hypothetical protein
MKLIENMDYSWENVESRIHALKNRLGFGSKIEFLHLELEDSGEIVFNDPRDAATHPVNDERIKHFIYKILFYYSSGDDQVLITPAEENFTKISLLDDSMHLGCSTNQHRLENEFRKLFDMDLNRVTEILEKHFQATDAHKGDVSRRLPLLPRVPALLVYYMPEDDCEMGEEFIESSLTIFFEKNANKYLPPNVCESLEDVFLFLVKKFI